MVPYRLQLVIYLQTEDRRPRGLLSDVTVMTSAAVKCNDRDGCCGVGVFVRRLRFQSQLRQAETTREPHEWV